MGRFFFRHQGHAGLLAQLVLVCAARAQTTEYPPPMTLDDHAMHCAALELDAGADDMQALFNAYAVDRAGADRARATIQGWLMSIGPHHWGAVADETTPNLFNDEEHDASELRWGRAIRELEAEYFRQLVAMAPQRAALVTSLERRRLRSWVFFPRHAQVTTPAGAMFDLVAAVEEVHEGKPAIEDVAVALAEHEQQVDGLLRQLIDAREMFAPRITATRKDLVAAAHERGPNNVGRELDAWAEAWVSKIRVEEQICALNRRTVSLLMPLLPQPEAGRLDDLACSALLPKLYDQTAALRAAEAAERLVDLTDAQREAIASLRSAFVADRAARRQEFERLYLATVSSDAMSDRYRAQAEWFVKWTLAADRSSMEPASGTHDAAEAELKEAIEQWQARAAQIHGQMLDALSVSQRSRVQ